MLTSDQIEAFYRDEYAQVAASQADAIEEAAEVLSAIYQENVFPEMSVGWGTYPNHIGHTDFPGCFRCHDDLHDRRPSPPLRGWQSVRRPHHLCN